MPLDADRYSLVADIGGTNTRVALAEGDRLLPDTVKKFRNADHADLASVLRLYIADNENVDCSGAAVAIAGPVRDGQGRLTNLDWQIDTATLADATRAEKTAVLNDLQAQGYAIGRIDPEFIQTVRSGPTPVAGATCLVIGVGTGFNAAPVFSVGDLCLVPPSEAGHTSMPIRSDDDQALADYVHTAHGFAAVEDVLSGRGLERVYAFCADRGGLDLRKSASGIMQDAKAGDSLATEATRHASRLLGTVAGDLALTYLPFGGLFLIGGVARALAPYLQAGGFHEAFRDKGRFSDFMDQFSVSLVTDDFAALTGSARYLARL